MGAGVVRWPVNCIHFQLRPCWAGGGHKGGGRGKWVGLSTQLPGQLPAWWGNWTTEHPGLFACSPPPLWKPERFLRGKKNVYQTIFLLELSQWLASLWGLICLSSPFCLCLSPTAPHPELPLSMAAFWLLRGAMLLPTAGSCWCFSFYPEWLSVLLFTWLTAPLPSGLSLHTTSLHPPTWYWVRASVTLSQSTYHTGDFLLKVCPLHWIITLRGQRLGLFLQEMNEEKGIYINCAEWMITSGTHCTFGG